MLLKTIVDVAFGLGLFVNALLFVPQIIKVWRAKSAHGLSVWTFGGFNLIQLVSILYGYYAHDFILMLGFGLSFISCGVVTVLILFYKRR